VVDTGIDVGHAEFAEGAQGLSRPVANLWDAFSEDGAGGLGAVVDDVGHGTHCAGIIGGRSVGVAPGAGLYGVKVLNAKGEGADIDIVRGLQFVLDWHRAQDRRATVVSMSLGGVCGSRAECADDIVVAAVEKLTAAGVAVVVAAGNSDCDACLQTPAFAPSAITVGAADAADNGAVFSDYGKCVDVFAPGVDIVSSCARALCGGDGDFTSMSGTSMAAPFVSGVVAQLLQANKEFSPAQVRKTD
jgi:subtilisin family serine protease